MRDEPLTVTASPVAEIDVRPDHNVVPDAVHRARGKKRRDWNRRIARWFAGAAAMGYGTSLLVHAILLLCCSVIVVVGAGSDQLSILAGLSSPDDEYQHGFDRLIDTKIDLPDAETSLLTVAPLESNSPGESQLVPATLAANALTSAGASGNDGQESNEGGGHKFKIPSGGNVVRQGNFIAWTEPQDPAPGQIYTIILQINLPKRVLSYRSSDLSGMVEGTDHYRQELPGNLPKYLPVKKNSVQLEIPVPGASELVEDKIQIRSKLLNEEQILKIVF